MRHAEPAPTGGDHLKSAMPELNEGALYLIATIIREHGSTGEPSIPSGSGGNELFFFEIPMACWGLGDRTCGLDRGRN